MILIKTIFTMRFIVLFCLSGILFFSCSSEPHHHRKPYTGDYDVVVNLSEEILNFDHIKDTIREHINQAKSEINDLKLEDKINVEHSLTIEEDGQNIINEDSLKATIKDLGSNIGELAKSITEFAGNISMKSLDLLSGLKNNLNNIYYITSLSDKKVVPLHQLIQILEISLNKLTKEVDELKKEVKALQDV